MVDWVFYVILDMPRLCQVTDIKSGQALGPHQEGEIQLKGEHIMKGYKGNPRATLETIDSEGWMRTGTQTNTLLVMLWPKKYFNLTP